MHTKVLGRVTDLHRHKSVRPKNEPSPGRPHVAARHTSGRSPNAYRQRPLLPVTLAGVNVDGEQQPRMRPIEYPASQSPQSSNLQGIDPLPIPHATTYVTLDTSRTYPPVSLTLLRVRSGKG